MACQYCGSESLPLWHLRRTLLRGPERAVALPGSRITSSRLHVHALSQSDLMPNPNIVILVASERRRLNVSTGRTHD